MPGTPVRDGRVARPAALRVTAYFARVYAKSWQSSVLVSALSPVLYVAALGIGLGSVIDHHGHTASLDGVSYLQFVAPGLVAATAMQVAAGEATFPVMGAIKWNRTYEAMLATPIGVTDVLVGHLLWIVARLAMSLTGYLVVVALFGALHSPLAVLALPAGVLTGTAFAAVLMAFSATQTNDQAFAAIFRLLVVPLFLFSGTFFPISQLPRALQVAAEVTPLYHGVTLCRDLATGRVPAAATAAHAGYLLALTVLGVVLARRAYQRRLRT